jgi:hypothetical protein
MPLFGKKKDGTDKVLDEIRKAVDGVNVSQQPNVSQESQAPEAKVDIIEEMQKNFEQRQREQKQFEHGQLGEDHSEHKREEVKQEFKEPERPAFAPLFVKIDRYRQILNSIGYLKTTMIMIKNSLMTLNELDRAREETFKLIQDAVGKLEGRLSTLDQELIRPSGYHEINEKPEYQDVETVEATVADLKGQIEQLRAELQSMS